MTKKGVKRKLAAILSADVKGYSRLMGEDEEATIRPLFLKMGPVDGHARYLAGRRTFFWVQ